MNKLRLTLHLIDFILNDQYFLSVFVKTTFFDLFLYSSLLELRIKINSFFRHKLLPQILHKLRVKRFLWSVVVVIIFPLWLRWKSSIKESIDVMFPFFRRILVRRYNPIILFTCCHHKHLKYITTLLFTLKNPPALVLVGCFSSGALCHTTRIIELLLLFAGMYRCIITSWPFDCATLRRKNADSSKKSRLYKLSFCCPPCFFMTLTGI